MRCSLNMFSKLFYYIRIIFIMIWISNLALTDSYISVYVMIAFAAFFCIIQLNKSHSTLTHREIIVLSLVSLLFSVLTIFANYPIFTRIRDLAFIQASTNLLVNLINILLSFIGGFFVAYSIFHYFYIRIKSRVNIVTRTANDKSHFMYVGFAFSIILFIYLLHLFLVEFPGNVTEDTFTQIEEMLSGKYSNFNTFWHTIFLQGILSAGYNLFGDINSAVAFFCVIQAVILAAAFTFCLSTLYLSGVSMIFLAAAFLVYSIFPYNIALSITVWKDVLFSAGCLFMICSTYRIIYNLGHNPICNYIVVVLGSLLFVLSRNNGWYVFLVFVLILILSLRKYKLLLGTLTAVLVGCWILINPVLAILNVSNGDYSESISVPLQQVSRVIVDGGELTEEETALISQILDIDEVPDLYTNWLSDPIKVEFRSNNTTFFEENIDSYVALWIKLGLRYPGSYLKAWVDQTKGYWNGGYRYAMYSETVTDNPYGVEKSAGNNLIATLFRLYFGLSRHVIFFEPFHSIGLHAWITAICCLFNAMLKRRKWVLSVPMLVIVFGLCLGTPVYASFRYAYPVFVSFPLILGTTLFHFLSAEE